jgi:ESCRT-II complex subunit VPS36
LQDQKINDSFKDLNILMNQAKEMVNLSNVLIGKLAKNNSNEKSEDSEDMNKLKGYFANMGIIDNPVTKETSGSKYYKDLAMEISHNFTQTIINEGGIMTLADVYCRLNRARGIAGLISSEDLLNACKQINKMNLKLKYNVYNDLNLHVLEIETSKANKEKLDHVCELIENNESLTPYALSKLLNINMIVAKKFLLDAEKLGRLCRDDTNVGLKFYPNLFLTK